MRNRDDKTRDNAETRILGTRARRHGTPPGASRLALPRLAAWPNRAYTVPFNEHCGRNDRIPLSLTAIFLESKAFRAPTSCAARSLRSSRQASSRQVEKKRDALRGRTLINLFFEASTRTQSSFELAGKRLGADVMNMSVATSSVKKGETLIDTAMTLNAMRPDILVVRHHAAGAVELLAQKVDCSVINAGDGSHEHPTQALLDALTIRRHKGRIDGLIVAICGDIPHSRVARSNILLLNALGARVRVVAPSTLLPPASSGWASRSITSMREG